MHFSQNAIRIALLYSGFISITSQTVNKYSAVYLSGAKMRFCKIGHFGSLTNGRYLDFLQHERS